MPTTSNRNLTLTTTGDQVNIRVEYDAVFTQFERFLAENGLVFQERIRILGVDPPGSTIGIILITFVIGPMPVTPGAGSQTIHRDRNINVTRASLQEDAGLGDADEIRASIEIIPIGIPTKVQEFTDQEVLLG